MTRMCDAVRAMRLSPAHLLAIEVQPSQAVQMGVPLALDNELANTMGNAPHGFAVLDGSRVVCCMGIMEPYVGRQGVAWAFFARDLMRAHVVITKTARTMIAGSGLRRIEAVCPAPAGAETLSDALAAPTPEMRWARCVGLPPAYLLRAFGAASEPFVLHERMAA